MKTHTQISAICFLFGREGKKVEFFFCGKVVGNLFLVWLHFWRNVWHKIDPLKAFRKHEAWLSGSFLKYVQICVFTRQVRIRLHKKKKLSKENAAKIHRRFPSEYCILGLNVLFLTLFSGDDVMDTLLRKLFRNAKRRSESSSLFFINFQGARKRTWLENRPFF